MLDLKYSLVIEATDDPNFFSFYSPDLIGFTGTGHSIDNCLSRARAGMAEHMALLTQQNLPIPEARSHPTVVVQDEERISSAA